MEGIYGSAPPAVNAPAQSLGCKACPSCITCNHGDAYHAPNETAAATRRLASDAAAAVPSDVRIAAGYAV